MFCPTLQTLTCGSRVQVRELEGMALTSEQKNAVAAANRREQAMYERRKAEIQDSIEQARTLPH